MKGLGPTHRHLAFFLTVILLFPLPGIASTFHDLGIPVRDAMMWGTYVGPGKSGLRDTIYLSYGQYEAPLFLLAINPDSGEIRQFNGPLRSEMGAWGFAIDHENRIYLGSYNSAHLLRFDPKTERWEDLGQPGGDKESHVCQLTTAPDGKIWGGTFPSTHLFCYDPKTGETRNYGRMDPDQFYCYPTAGDDGLIYCAIQFEKMDIVVFDPKTNMKRPLLSSGERKPGRLRLVKGTDGKVFAKFLAQDKWFRIDEGERLVEVPETAILLPKNILPDGRLFRVKDRRALRIEDPVTQASKEIPLRYEAEGAYIFVVGTGPDGRIHGSTMLPLRLFAFDPEKRSLLNLGKVSQAEGEIYSMGSLEGKLYFCVYPEARLCIYDPKRPALFSDREDSNPKDLGPIGDQQYRPRAMVAGPHGRVYIGSYPDYGQLGGAITVYDPAKDLKRVYRHVIQQQSVASLSYLRKLDLMAIGGSVRGGTGTHAVEKEAKLILWDPKNETTVFEITPVPGAKTIRSLAPTEDGILYGITENEKLFVFDAEKKEMRKVIDLEFKEPREVSLQTGPGGKLYGLAKEAIFVIDPKSDQVSLLAKPPVSIDSGMAILGQKIYFGSGAHLWEFELPPEPSPAN